MKFFNNKKKKYILGVLAMGLATFPILGCDNAPAAQPAVQKIAVVDYHELLQNHPERKTAEEEMQKYYQEFQKKAEGLKADADAPQADQMKAYTELQKEVTDKQDALFKPVRDGVDKSLDEVMKEKGYTSVFSREALVRGGDDITIDVLRKEGASDDDIKAVENRMNIAAQQGN